MMMEVKVRTVSKTFLIQSLRLALAWDFICVTNIHLILLLHSTLNGKLGLLPCKEGEIQMVYIN